MTRRLSVLLFALFVPVPVCAQVFFACGNKEHTPSHSASTLDEAKALTKRYGCSAWHVHSPDTGNSMPIPNERWQLQQMRIGTFRGQLGGLNEYSKETVSASAWTQLRPENLQQQPFKIVVTSTRIEDGAQRFRIAVSSAAPELHGYLTLASLRGGDRFAIFASTDRFAEIKPKVDAGMATFEFDYQPAQSTLAHPSLFTLADASLEGDGATPKNVYWLYLKDFADR
jgi:hypothetical protein